MKFCLVNLGCAKNVVDSELMNGQLIEAGFIMVENPDEAETIVVNTCGFTEDAANESIDTILELAELKKTGICKRFIVAGCLVQRFKEEIASELPEVDLFVGTGGLGNIAEAVHEFSKPGSCYLPKPDCARLQSAGDARILKNCHAAYVKISEGCSRHCTYCIIPNLRGRQRSRRVKDIIAEVNAIVVSGVKEVTLVAQDTTFYGADLSPPENLSMLLDGISKIKDDIWIRFLYGHPSSINEPIIKTVAEHSNICPYFDIPIQHSETRILKNMGRDYNKKELFRLYDYIVKTAPHAALRTSIIVGFPGETDKDFSMLLNFVKDIGFDHLGAFIYSDSEDVPSHRLCDHVSPGVAQERYNELMLRQQEISLKNNRKHINKSYRILVEEAVEKDIFMGRTFFQAPEVDGITYVHGEGLCIGDFSNVKISEAFEYDLVGKAL